MSENSTEAYLTNNSSTMDGPSNTTNDHCDVDSTTEKVLKVAAYCIILLVALIGNVLIIVVFSKKKAIRRSINYFVVNMAVSDLFTPLTIMPVTIAQVLSGSEAFLVHRPLALGNILCKLCHFLPDVSMIVSIGSLLLISGDRLGAVVFPLSTKFISAKMRLIGIACTWIMAISVHAPYFYAFRLEQVNEHGNSYQCHLNWGDNNNEIHKRFVTDTFIAFSLVPICVLTVIYSTIAWTLRRRQGERRKMSNSKRSCDHKKNRKIIQLSVAILVTFIVSVGPLTVYMFLSIFVWHWYPPLCALGPIPFIVRKFLLHSWGAINPCICFAFSENYRTGLKQMFCFQLRAYSRSSLPINTKTLSASRRTRSSASSEHFSLKVIDEGRQKEQQQVREDREREQEEEKSLEKQE